MLKCPSASHIAECLPFFSLQRIVSVCVLAGTHFGTKRDTYPLADAANKVVYRGDENDNMIRNEDEHPLTAWTKALSMTLSTSEQCFTGD
jgi:hypothetical protein